MEPSSGLIQEIMTRITLAPVKSFWVVVAQPSGAPGDLGETAVAIIPSITAF
jgi:hypothetical protein